MVPIDSTIQKVGKLNGYPSKLKMEKLFFMKIKKDELKNKTKEYSWSNLVRLNKSIFIMLFK